MTLRQNIYVLYRSITDPDVPWYAKLLVGLIVAYIISPIDFIPDFIPVLVFWMKRYWCPLELALP